MPDEGVLLDLVEVGFMVEGDPEQQDVLDDLGLEWPEEEQPLEHDPVVEPQLLDTAKIKTRKKKDYSSVMFLSLITYCSLFG